MARSKYHELIVSQSPALPRSLAGMEVVSDHVGSDRMRHLFLIRPDDKDAPGDRPKPRPQSAPQRTRAPRRPKSASMAAPTSQPSAPSPATAFPGAEVKGA